VRRIDAMNTKVLIVDDEEDFVEALAERMSYRGIKVDIATTGEMGIEKAKEKSYDAIILDLAMPGMDGIEVQKILLETNPDLQIIFLTGHATLEKGIEAMKHGAVEFMEKPVDINTLLEKVGVAKTKKQEITEKKIDEKIKNILKKKGW
jgi:DNA-binding NtrC family response regulator